MVDHFKQIKTFQGVNLQTVEREVNNFLHPLKGARIGTMHYSCIATGVAQLHVFIVEYIEMNPTEDFEEKVINLDEENKH